MKCLTTRLFFLKLSFLLFATKAIAQTEGSVGLPSSSGTGFTLESDFNPYSEVVDQKALLYQSIAASYQIPYHSDQDIERKLMSIPSEIPLSFTPEIGQMVRNFIYNKRDYLTRMLTASQIYFPIFEEVLLLKGLPLELKYLAIIESALKPNAKSRVGATGLWQFMSKTAKQEGLSINTYLDERKDVYLSTEYAASFLKKLYYSHNDWFLALAAYNSGSGNVHKAIRNSFGYDFWSIKHKLPRETQNYVPTFIAMMYCMHYANEYKLFAEKPTYNFANTVKEKIYDKLSLKYIAELIGSCEAELCQYNPSLKLGIIPSSSFGYDLILPKQYSMAFRSSKHLLYEDPYLKAAPSSQDEIADLNIEPENASPTMTRMESVDANSSKRINVSIPDGYNQKYKIVKVTEIVEKELTYKMKKGELLNEVADRYNVSISEIYDWNNLTSSSEVYAGMMLTIFKKEKVTKPQYEINSGTQSLYASKPTSSKSISERQVIHKIKKGETLVQLTRIYGVTLSQIIEWNSLKVHSVNIGQELYIYPSATYMNSAENKMVENNYAIKSYSYYEASKGDTLQTASTRLHVSLEELKSLNNMDENEPLKEGEKIKIPSM